MTSASGVSLFVRNVLLLLLLFKNLETPVAEVVPVDATVFFNVTVPSIATSPKETIAALEFCKSTFPLIAIPVSLSSPIVEYDAEILPLTSTLPLLEIA